MTSCESVSTRRLVGQGWKQCVAGGGNTWVGSSVWCVAGGGNSVRNSVRLFAKAGAMSQSEWDEEGEEGEEPRETGRKSTSKHRGVSWDKAAGKWKARIKRMWP